MWVPVPCCVGRTGHRYLYSIFKVQPGSRVHIPELVKLLRTGTDFVIGLLQTEKRQSPWYTQNINTSIHGTERRKDAYKSEPGEDAPDHA